MTGLYIIWLWEAYPYLCIVLKIVFQYLSIIKNVHNLILYLPGDGRRGSAISWESDLWRRPTENLLFLSPVRDISPVSSSCTEERGTSRHGAKRRGLFAKNSTISDAAGRFLYSLFQQDLIKHSLVDLKLVISTQYKYETMLILTLQCNTYSCGLIFWGILRVFPPLTYSNTWLFDIPWNGKLPNVMISYKRTP